jgi:small subunit ribosomal protein S1
MEDTVLVASEDLESEETAAEAQTLAAPVLESPPPQESDEGGAPRPEHRRRRRRRRADLSKLQAGQQYQGRVAGLADFGAFVDIGVGRDGLVHISEIKEGFVQKVDAILSVGQTVRVWVKDVDPDRGRISLTMIEPQSNRLSLTELEPGMVLEGTVEGVANFGAFVDIGAPVNGLVHISEMSEGYVQRPQSVVSPGDGVTVRVLEVDRQDRKISLSMKGVNSEEAPAEVESATSAEPTMTAMEFAWQQALAARENGEE